MRKSLYSDFFARIYDPFMDRIERKVLEPRRNRLLSTLEGRVLDIGSGTGINFPHYDPEKTSVIAADPSEAMMKRAIGKTRATPDSDTVRADRKHIEFIHGGIGDSKLENIIKEESLDAIVSTLVLCTVPDPVDALARFHKWLRPGGKLIVLEHIRSHKRIPSVTQKLATPVWQIVAEGCHLDRPTDLLIKNTPFELIKDEYFRILIPFYEGVYRKRIADDPTS